MPGSCTSRPPGVEPGRAFRRRLRGWEQREIAQLASALGASGVVSFRVHGVQVQLQHDISMQGAEQQQAQPAASPTGITGLHGDGDGDGGGGGGDGDGGGDGSRPGGGGAGGGGGSDDDDDGGDDDDRDDDGCSG